MHKFFKTKKEFTQFKKWIAALDSGDYRQSKFALQNEAGYCCLGVACKVLIPDKDKVFYLNTTRMYGGGPSNQPKSPDWLQKINKAFGDITDLGIMSLNDSYGYSFSEIATCLELVFIHGVFGFEYSYKVESYF